MEIDGAFDGLIQNLISVLPTSPFAPFIVEISSLPGLPWLNWFFPVGKCLQVLAAWCAAIALFYVYSVVMRWVKMIGD